jgi:hypothetical protein
MAEKENICITKYESLQLFLALNLRKIKKTTLWKRIRAEKINNGNCFLTRDGMGVYA